jgi:photosystem II stability/assembly factor-like uncharacterized protein
MLPCIMKRLLLYRRLRSLFSSLVISVVLFVLSQSTLQSTAADSSLSISNGKRLESRPLDQALTSTASPAAFHLLTEDEGWLLLGQKLYWTRDGGRTWSNITPAPFSNPPIANGKSEASFGATSGVFFLDTRRGWFVGKDASGRYTTARTADAGVTWETRSMALFSPGDADGYVASLHLYFLDAQTGWLVARRATSSAFDIGALFKTADGGDTWTRQSIPIGDPVYFATADMGWVAGGAAHNRLYVTRDGGETWKSTELPTTPPSPIPNQAAEGNGGRYPLLPKFDNAHDGVLPVLVAAGHDSHLDLYRTRNGGISWELTTVEALGEEISPGTRFPITLLNADQAISILTERRGVANHSPGGLDSFTPSGDPFIPGIRELDMANPLIGWAKQIEGNCTNGDKTRCTLVTHLMRTTDGGQTWVKVELPINSPAPLIPPTSPLGTGVRGDLTVSPTSFVATVTGQGFDACGLPTLSQFHSWWVNSPYMAYNLYIGGSALAACDALSASFVSALASEGWKFFPTWVGPQAPCAGFASRISYDTTTAFNQGVAQADLALDAAYNLGLTDATKSGTVIYYDLEAYNTSNSACRAAVDSFISGWTGRLQTRANVAGAYGASCSSAVSDWAGLNNIPDIVWIANWIYASYNSSATVWDASCLDNTLWVNHQRLRQYAGGHNETWGGVTLNIDSDVLDGVIVSLSKIKPRYRYFLPFLSK